MTIQEQLEAPFPDHEVKYRPVATSGDKTRALAAPYVDAKSVRNRLNSVLGVAGWQSEIRPHGDGFICKLSIRTEEGWVSREDVGCTEGGERGSTMKMKGGSSDALKRAAKLFGVAVYLEQQKPQWLAYDAQKKQFTERPRGRVQSGYVHGAGYGKEEQQRAAAAPVEPACDEEDRKRIQALVARFAEGQEQTVAAFTKILHHDNVKVQRLEQIPKRKVKGICDWLLEVSTLYAEAKQRGVAPFDLVRRINKDKSSLLDLTPQEREAALASLTKGGMA